MASRYARPLGWTAAIVVLLVAGVLAWALTSQSALNWTVERLHSAAGGKLAIEGARRTGILSLTAERVRYTEEAALSVDVREAVMAVRVAPLLRGRLMVQALTARLVEVRTAPSDDDEPPALPQSLELPLPVEVRALRIGRLVIASGSEPIALSDLDAAASYDGARHRLTVRTLQTPWAAVQARLDVGAARPFPLDGSLNVTPAFPDTRPAYVAIAGELGALGLGIIGETHGARVSAQAAVMPFAASTLASIEAEAGILQLRSVLPALPRASLGASASVQVERSGAMTGRFDVVNRDPGLPAQERLPVARVQGRFAGEGGTWTLSDLALDAGRAGRVTGEARLTADGIDARLRAQGLNLVGLHEALYPTAWSGPIRVVQSAGTIRFEAALGEAATQIALAGTYAGDRIELSQAQWRGPAGSVEAQGEVVLSERTEFRADGRVRGFDPARVGHFPPARLNAQFSAQGQARPLAVQVDAKVADSRFRDQPLAGTVRANVQPERIRDALLDLRLGRARAHAQGSLGTPGDRLTFEVEVPNAQLIHPETRGSLRAAGAASGTLLTPDLDVTLSALDLRYGDDFALGRLSGKAAVAAGGTGRVEVELSARTLRLSGLDVADAAVVAQGTRARHEVRLSALASDHRLQAQVVGGLDDRQAWQGMLQALRLDGALPVRLVQPVEVAASAEAARIGSARIEVGKDGYVDLALLDWDARAGLRSRGSLGGIELASLGPLLPVPEAVRSLMLAGRWDVSMTDTLDGSAVLTREAGDISLPGSPAVPAKLRTLRIEAQARGNEISIDARVESATFGQATATGSTRAEQRAGRWGIAGDAPIRGQVQADMPSLDWTRPLLRDAGASISGRAAATVRVGGTIAAPVYEGQVAGEDVSVRLPELGLTLREGVLKGTFDAQRLAIETLSFLSGEGRVAGTGNVRLVPGDLSAQIALAAQNLTVLARPDRLAIVSGKLDLAWSPRGLKATGQFTADRGVIELPREDTPQPSSDVVVLGAKPKAAREFNVEADLSLDLGRNFSLRGKGLDTRLAGTLRAQVNPKAGISLTGTVRAVDGTYSAFGRKLTLSRGSLTFVGPVDNPSLDILAVRVVSDVEVGVAVGGTALVPQIRLVSTPPMSDANKLAWLTLGHGLDEAGKNEAAVLQAAALALLSRGETDSKGTLASRFGLDHLALGTASGTGERIVSLGKRFASNFYVGFERGITGAVSVIQVTYNLSRRWSVQARAGSENAVDLFYTLGFR